MHKVTRRMYRRICCGVVCGWQRLYLWLRRGLRKQTLSMPYLIEKGAVCWLHRNRGLLLAMFQVPDTLWRYSLVPILLSKASPQLSPVLSSVKSAA